MPAAFHMVKPSELRLAFSEPVGLILKFGTGFKKLGYPLNNGYMCKWCRNILLRQTAEHSSEVAVVFWYFL